MKYSGKGLLMSRIKLDQMDTIGLNRKHTATTWRVYEELNNGNDRGDVIFESIKDNENLDIIIATFKKDGKYFDPYYPVIVTVILHYEDKDTQEYEFKYSCEDKLP